MMEYGTSERFDPAACRRFDRDLFPPCAFPRGLTGSLLRMAAVLLTGTLLLAGTAAGQNRPVDFREQIQPILAANCYFCHGPDEAERQAGLRLDLRESMRLPVIGAGNPGESELVRRIFSADPAALMPPPGSHRSLTDEQRDLLKRWVESGAEWQGHWAFEPIQPQSPPPATGEWPKNAIDRFVLARLNEHALAPSPPADRRTLIRRASMDLTGLGPTPEEVQAFLDDRSPDAWERVLDRLLDSPRFGEQMAVEWLDAARFADTNGYQNDFVRSLWPWRDWVIGAFNSGLPYDRFVVEQIAGDLLPAPAESQLIATGFNRNNRSVTEGGSIEEEWRIENCIDRVETTAAAFLGLTVGCARCHDHKYDPFSQKEFYRFFAFFNNIDELGVYNEARGNVGPQLKLPTPEQAAELARLDARLAELKTRSLPDPGLARKKTENWRTETGTSSAGLPEPVFRFTPPDAGVTLGTSPVGVSAEFPGKADAVPPVEPSPVRFQHDLPFSWSAWIQGDARGAIFGKMDESAAYRGVDAIVLPDGRLKIHLIHVWQTRAIAVISKSRLVPGEWNFVAVTWDGGSKASGYRIWFDGQPAESETEVDTLDGPVETGLPFRIGQRSSSVFLRGAISDFRLYDCELTPQQVLVGLQSAVLDRSRQLAETDFPGAGGELLERYLALSERNAASRELAALQATRDALESGFQTTMIMRERDGYRPTHLLKRGQYDQPDTSEDLWPAIPSMLPPLADGQPPNRLGLAEWMVYGRNPLVARVAVNRAWMKLFGRGLVETADNFGVQGTPPTHPLLVDWLADDFRRSGWNWKRLLKQIMTSATYCQSSVMTDDRRGADPENRWYSRGPRYRLSAEQIRDNALAVSGLLVERTGGPSVRPWQPDGLWEELAGGANNGPYETSRGDDLYRRSLYTYRKRTVSHPTLSTFDAPGWEICQIRRSRTNTPLQSLALLNDVTYVEAARNLAGRMMQAGGGSVDEGIRHGFRLALQRDPEERELATLTAGHAEYLAWYGGNGEAAGQLLAVGRAPVDPSFAKAELAAMTSVAAVLLNLDEMITRE